MKKLVIAGLMSVVATAAFAQSTSNTTKNNSVGTPPEKPAAASGYASPTPTPQNQGASTRSGGSSGSMGAGSSGSSGSMGAGGSSSSMGTSSGSMGAGSGSGSMGAGSSSGAARGQGTAANSSVGTPPEKPAAASGYASPTPTPQNQGASKNTK